MEIQPILGTSTSGGKVTNIWGISSAYSDHVLFQPITYLLPRPLGLESIPYAILVSAVIGVDDRSLQ